MMTDSKKKRMSMLDALASTGAPVASGAMMNNNRALRSARDAVDAHHVWELDPSDIDDSRYADRLDPSDVADLRNSIEANGQTVPILVRRNADLPGRYLLVYGRRRLEAIRASDRVEKVRALIAQLDDNAALRAQVSENTGRRDLSYVERALFAQELLDSGFGNQAQVAEVLNATKSAISMALSVVRAVGSDLVRAIGPAHGIGRPRWEALARDIGDQAPDLAVLIQTAQETRQRTSPPADDTSTAAFEAVMRFLKKTAALPPTEAKHKARRLVVAGQTAGQVQQTPKGVRIDLAAADKAFAQWLESQAQALAEELHARWQQRG